MAKIEDEGFPDITLTIHIDNVYEDGKTVSEDKTITVPPPLYEGHLVASGVFFDGTAHQDWAYEWLFAETGTGQEHGDAGYFVKITACDQLPELVGNEYEWGV